MIFQLIKKQILIFLRRPSQLQLIFGMPILFIGILGFSLGGFINGDSASSIEMNMALIEHGDEDEQVQRFIRDVEKSGIGSEEKASIRESVGQLAPIGLLKKDVFEAMDDVLHVDMVKASQKEQIFKQDDYIAVVEVPEQFTYDTLNHIFLESKGKVPAIQVYQGKKNRLSSSALVDVLEQFQEQLTLMSFAGKHGISPEILDIDTDTIIEETESIGQGEPVSAKTYYTIGMAVMYVMFIATLTSFWAYYEKKVHVFNRVIISNISRWTYLFGIFVTGTILAFIHLSVVYGIALLLYGITIPNLPGFLIITLAVSLAVGGLATLLAAISYQIDSQSIINLFASFIVYIFAFVGGSFFPIGEYSKFIQMLGNATPNGAGMTAYLTIVRGGSIADVLPLVMSLVLFGGIMMIAAIVCFPKRGAEI